jgi:hypothetical protein
MLGGAAVPTKLRSNHRLFTIALTVIFKRRGIRLPNEAESWSSFAKMAEERNRQNKNVFWDCNTLCPIRQLVEHLERAVPDAESADACETAIRLAEAMVTYGTELAKDSLSP